MASASASISGPLLAAVVANASRTAGPPLRAQVLIYPCTDMEPDRWPSMTENANGYLLTRAAMEWFYGHYIDSEQRADPRAAPIREADLAGAPAALVLTAEFDPLRDEGEAYAAALTDAGVATTLSRYDGLIHGFIGMHDAIDQSVAAQEEVAQFLRETLS